MHIARLFVLCSFLLGLPVFAATAPNLYQVHEPISSQQPGERDAGLVQALQTLLARLTGNPQAPQNPALAGYLKDPQQLISRYAFENGPLLALVVDFDPTAIGNMLRATGLSSWGANRPAVLAWWLNESADGSTLVGDSQTSVEPLKRVAQNRGSPLRLPLAGLDEQIVGTPENLTTAQPDALRAVSERYAAGALLVVDAKETDGKWQAQWRLWMDDSREQGRAEGVTPGALADGVMLAVGNRLPIRFIATPGTAIGLTLQVQGTTLARYAELQRLLDPLDACLVGVRSDHLDYSVKVSLEQLRAQLGLAQLQEIPVDSVPLDVSGQPAAPSATASSSSQLNFH